MAKVDCIACDCSYVESNHAVCPKCGTPDYILDSDPVVVNAAVDVFINQISLEQRLERNVKLKNINSLRPPGLLRRVYNWLSNQ